MTIQTVLRCTALALALALPFQQAAAHGSLRKLTAAEAAHYARVGQLIKNAMPKQCGPLKLIDENINADLKSTQIDTKHAADKGYYSLWHSFEYGRTVDDIRAAAKMDEKLGQAQNEGNEAKERALMEQLAQLVSAQRCYVDVGTNHGLVDFTYEKGKVETLAVNNAVAYRSRFASDPASNVPYVVATLVGIGTYGSPKNDPYDGNEGGAFQVAALGNRGTPDFAIHDIVVRIYAAPALADQFIRQLDVAGLKAQLGKRIQ